MMVNLANKPASGVGLYASRRVQDNQKFSGDDADENSRGRWVHRRCRALANQ